ncbi:MAG: TIGR02449 family protein [Gammaproteobacteria bacterium]|nr:TIGR02449 family protein [Gammaproteobacteria bacterium]
MATDTTAQTEQDLKKLAGQIDDLLRLCERLTEENRVLRAQTASLMTERAGLAEKTALARSRVEAMIMRLKSLEYGS